MADGLGEDMRLTQSERLKNRSAARATPLLRILTPLLVIASLLYASDTTGASSHTTLTEAWTTQVGNSLDNSATAVVADGDAVYVTGFSGGVSGPAGGGLLRKFNTSGDELWTQFLGIAGQLWTLCPNFPVCFCSLCGAVVNPIISRDLVDVEKRVENE